jgi:hypothetical protein
MANLLRCLQHQRCSQEELDTLIGRLNHTAAIIPLSCDFLGQLREQIDCEAFLKATAKFSQDEIKDLMLWKRLLVNDQGCQWNLSELGCCPILVSCLLVQCMPFWHRWIQRLRKGGHGASGFQNLVSCTVTLGMVVNVWLGIEDVSDAHQCILALGDNTSAIGWLFTSSKFLSLSLAHKAHLMVAPQLATLVLTNNHCLASQHLKGELNIIANFLSFNGYSQEKSYSLAFDCPPDSILTQRFHQYLHKQIPENFAISLLPSNILSWIAVTPPKDMVPLSIPIGLATGQKKCTARDRLVLKPASLPCGNC